MADSVASFRKAEGLTQTQLAGKLGVASKAYVSDLENGRKRWPLKLALKMEAISSGRVVAASICQEAADLAARTAERSLPA